MGLARANFARSGLEGSITLVHDDAGRVLRPGGLLVVDNATSHAAEMAPFVALVQADAEFVTSLVPVGNGEFLAVKSRG